jgi:hypothetical protein
LFVARPRHAPLAQLTPGLLAKSVTAVQHLLWDYFFHLDCHLITCSPFSHSAVHDRSFTEFRAAKEHLL